MGVFKEYLTYRRAYREPSEGDVRSLALASWREYIQNRPRIYDMDFCRAYQFAFIRAYRASYAKAKVDDLKKFYN